MFFSFFNFPGRAHLAAAVHRGRLRTNQLRQLRGGVVHADLGIRTAVDALQATQDGATHQGQLGAAHHLSDRLPVPGHLLLHADAICGRNRDDHYTVWNSGLLSDHPQTGQMAGGHFAGDQPVVLQVLHLYAQPGEVRLGLQDSTTLGRECLLWMYRSTQL